MTTTIKKEFSAVDAAPTIQYVKRDAGSANAYPLTNAAYFQGLYIPQYDTSIQDASDPTDIVTTFSLSGTTVAILSVVTAMSITTTTLVYYGPQEVGSPMGLLLGLTYA